MKSKRFIEVISVFAERICYRLLLERFITLASLPDFTQKGAPNIVSLTKVINLSRIKEIG